MQVKQLEPSFGFLLYEKSSTNWATEGWILTDSDFSGDYGQADSPLPVSLFPLPHTVFSIYIIISLCSIIV